MDDLPLCLYRGGSFLMPIHSAVHRQLHMHLSIINQLSINYQSSVSKLKTLDRVGPDTWILGS